MTRRSLLTVWCLLIALTATARQTTDFVGLLLKKVEAAQATYPTDTYTCTTVTPTMMTTLVSAAQAEGDDGRDIAELVEQIKSLRIFTATNPELAPTYAALAASLLNKKSSPYVRLKGNDTDGQKTEAYVRKSASRVVELFIVFSNQTDFRVIDITGTIGQNFVQQLMQLTAPEPDKP